MSEHKPGRTAAGSACPRNTGGSPGRVSLVAMLRAQRSPFLPSSLGVVRVAAVGLVLRVGFAAPSPLGLLGPGG